MAEIVPPTSYGVSDYDPFMPLVVEGDPYPLYDTLRQKAPRLFLEPYGAWFFTTFEDVWSLSKQSGLSVAGGITPSQLLLGADANRFMVSQMDPPDHKLFRSALNSLFTANAARAMEAAARAEARGFLDTIQREGGGDILLGYAGPLAVAVGCWLSGLPREDMPMLMQWTNHFFHRIMDKPGDTHVGAQAGGEMIAYITDIMGQVRAGRRAPHGAMGVLLDMQRDDPAITDDHIRFIVLNLQIGAGDTVPKSISAAFHRLWENPVERVKLQADPTLALPAFAEAIRIDMPTQMQGRTAMETISYDGIEIQPGQKTMFLFAAANRDPAEFVEPGRYIIDRHNRRTLGFGNGIHRCLGAHIAEMEGRIAIEEVMATIPSYAIDLDASRKHKTEYVKGWSNVIVTL
ncbi:putative cytochrome P450 [Caenibius tardaugens NBRC 16725]|uniref:Putative cytochrome P450 n=1 Tax=Caenibius tardaugens NBRC 16725 TaxID=1219035 RepID=U2ZZW1_9SPHN|nr:cytochrome P450 [Caenibius tardaugens]AZI37945.1 cytochrome P450 [Caenibius tardaugens NBRC 16725]GAD50919.1 putative cytochrome P450 [Caenibius tardaugens NBRC 16725]